MLTAELCSVVAGEEPRGAPSHGVGHAAARERGSDPTSHRGHAALVQPPFSPSPCGHRGHAALVRPPLSPSPSSLPSLPHLHPPVLFRQRSRRRCGLGGERGSGESRRRRGFGSRAGGEETRERGLRVWVSICARGHPFFLPYINRCVFSFSS